jgi:hypothetical protein
MIRCLLLTLAILLICNGIANCQHYLFLKNGERIEFKKNSVTASKTEIKIKSVDEGKLKFKPEEVAGYYSLKDESTFYLKPETDDDSQLQTYDFMEKIVGGEINLYKNFFAGSAPAGPGGVATASRTYLYLQKGSDFRPLGLMEFHFIGNKSDKTRRTDILKSFVSDRPDLVATIEAEDFKPNEKSISEIVNDYNVSKYKPYANSTNPPSSVFFYLKGKVIQPVKLIVNENAEYTLSSDRLVSVSLPINQYTKICVNSHCELLESSQWYIRYFEVAIDDKEGKVEFNNVRSLDANFYFKRKHELEKEYKLSKSSSTN